MSRRKIVAAVLCSVSVIIAMVLNNSDSYYSQQGNALRFSQAAMEVMGNAEGCRRDFYLCPARISTQGICHTRRVTGAVSLADEQQVARWFAEDQLDAQNCLERNVERKLGARLPQNVFDGVGSFVFNVGCANSLTSTLYRYLTAGSYLAACHQLSRWVYVGQEVLPGLVARRAKEQALCLAVQK
ncbi:MULTISPECIES: lysozyme [Symbiopectobacterium]|uniref:lysozyme n=1 Tax=Symbiopectobacterium TaxID=801 RepID=UPI001A33359B|nr:MULTISPECIES: lysozyme [Symbiopectobacterium]MBG6248819.1 lysozyme [Candidatus Symbiopectobacterium sp. PLON1]MBT9430396.1 lysozyme [Candidatus Symbiopectobacterium endolongispinus]